MNSNPIAGRWAGLRGRLEIPTSPTTRLTAGFEPRWSSRCRLFSAFSRKMEGHCVGLEDCAGLRSPAIHQTIHCSKLEIISTYGGKIVTYIYIVISYIFQII